jgi:hypothetical protein
LIAYADTGFLVSLYGHDDHSAVAISLVKPRPVFLLTPLAETEFANAIELLRVPERVDRGRSAGRSPALLAASGGRSISRAESLGPETWEKALVLSRRHSAKLGTRTLDLLHVAAAVRVLPA